MGNGQFVRDTRTQGAFDQRPWSRKRHNHILFLRHQVHSRRHCPSRLLEKPSLGTFQAPQAWLFATGIRFGRQSHAHIEFLVATIHFQIGHAELLQIQICPRTDTPLSQLSSEFGPGEAGPIRYARRGWYGQLHSVLYMHIPQGVRFPRGLVAKRQCRIQTFQAVRDPLPNGNLMI